VQILLQGKKRIRKFEGFTCPDRANRLSDHVDYYRASSGRGLGILQSCYYYKCMTDQEYSAPDHIRHNTLETAVILAISVEEPILEYQNIVAEGRVVGTRNITAT